jgi:5-hydroxyisourate hydrolase
MKRISTHILDLVLGKPAADVAVRLEKRLEQQDKPGWRLLASERTDRDGRCVQLLPSVADFAAGIYRLIFETGSYYEAQKLISLYPLIEITFQVRDGDTDFHIPVLLSPNGYTTYRGS